MEKGDIINITELLGDRPFAIYPTEVGATLGFYELAVLAAGMVRNDPALNEVYQFVFVTEGGALSKLIRIEEENSSITELVGDARKWSFVGKD